MFNSYNNPCILLVVLCLYSLLIYSSLAQPPPEPYYDNSPSASPYLNTFDFVNTGSFSQYPQGEYGSTYREFRMSSFHLGMMSLCFYNTTPNAYYLALGPTPQFWVWVANPNDPVREGAKLSFKDDGNLVLVDADGRLVWQTNTSNMGVTGIQTRIYDQYGDMVLYDHNGNPVWQSFDHPTDTVFAHQFLRISSPDKLVSRVSTIGGLYSLVVMPNGVSLYYQSANSTKPFIYYRMFESSKTLDSVQFIAYNEYKPSFSEHFTDGTETRYQIADLTPPSDYPYNILASFMRLENNGDLMVYIYQKSYEDEFFYPGFSLFTERYGPRPNPIDSCLLPEKCGAFGICENDTCTTCPTAQGMIPWTSGKCEPPKLGACKPGAPAKYYKIQGVEHYSSKYSQGEGPMLLRSCKRKCNLDCKCVGYFYHLEDSKCWIAYDLMTLTKSSNVANHLGFIKVSK